MNVFETGERKVIPAVLIYVANGDDVLMIHRTDPTRRGDFHAGKWNGLGGKCEAGESAHAAAIRELQEESGIRAERLEPRGSIYFPLFKEKKAEDWWVSLFTLSLQGPKPTLSPCPEGELHWIRRETIPSLPMWEGDALFLPQILKGQTVFGTIWYRNGRVEKSELL